MTFEEALALLENGDFAKVAEQMAGWHPVVLGTMLRAVAVAKRRRYPNDHPGFNTGVESVLTAAGDEWKGKKRA